MALTHSPKIPTNGLVLCLDSGNKKSYPGSGTSWYDLSGNGNYGDFQNTLNYTPDYGGELGFSGDSNNYVNLPTFFTSNHYSVNQGWTVSAFVNITGTVTLNGGIFANQKYQSEDNPGGFGMSLRNNNGGSFCVNMTHDDGAGTKVSYESHTLMGINYNQIEQVVYSWDGVNTVSGYRNGEFVTQTVNSNYKWSPRPDGTIARVGTNTQGGWSTLVPMKIYKIDVYNRTLTLSEIRSLFYAHKSRFGL
jgi:hypothetical protein